MSENIESSVTKLLLTLGIAPYNKGFHYLRKAILIYLSNCGRNASPIKNIFSETASFFNVSESSVERAMRHSIQAGWYRRDEDIARKIFVNTLQTNYDHPTNSLFISAVGEWLYSEMFSFM